MTISINVHRVVNIKVGEVEVDPATGYRWQHVLVYDANEPDVECARVTLHLADSYRGLEFMQRPGTPQRRVDDIPRGEWVDIDPDGIND